MMRRPRIRRSTVAAALGLIVLLGAATPSLASFGTTIVRPSRLGGDRVDPVSAALSAVPRLPSADRTLRAQPPVLGWLVAGAGLAVVIVGWATADTRAPQPRVLRIRSGRRDRAPPR